MSGWVAGAVVVGSIAGGVISAQGAQSAAQTQANALTQAQQYQQNQFNTINAQEQPFLQGGYGALNQLDYLMGIPNPGAAQAPSGPSGYGGGGNVPMQTGGMIGGGGNYPSNGPGVSTGWTPNGAQLLQGPGGGTMPATATSAGGYQPGQAPSGSAVPGGYGSLNAPFTADMMKQYSPAYQFQLQQGGQGVLNGASNAQGSESGSAMKDLIGYNQNLANTAFDNAFNQYTTQQSNTYNRLAGLVNTGSSAAANLGAQGVQLAGNQSSLAASRGAALAAGQVGAANAYSGAVSTASMVPWLMASNKAPVATSNPGAG